VAQIDLKDGVVGVVGAGTMGIGVAETAARAGHRVFLFDVSESAAQTALSALADRLDGRVARGKIARDDADAILSRLTCAPALDALAPCALIVEAVVEDLKIKQDLFSSLERLAGPDAILASNTSSISITAIARPLEKPGRVAGLHFFNPAPVMKLVEVVPGLQTTQATVRTLLGLCAHWEKVGVQAKSVPGFIVNRVARPFYAEGFLALEQGVAAPAQIDALIEKSAGFRMGPLALADLIGHDVNAAVAQGVFDACNGHTRFRPSLAQQELVAAGRLGRKSGCGIYRYDGAGDPQTPPAPSLSPPPPPAAQIAAMAVRFSPAPTGAALWCRDALRKAGHAPETDRDLAPGQWALAGGVVSPNAGRSALALSTEIDKPCIVHDWAHDPGGSRLLGFSASTPDMEQAFLALLSAVGVEGVVLKDRPGLIALRTIAMIVNAACDAARDEVAREDDIDRAMRFGVNYPRGPFEWADLIGPAFLTRALSSIAEETGDPIYLPSEYLRRRAALSGARM